MLDLYLSVYLNLCSISICQYVSVYYNVSSVLVSVLKHVLDLYYSVSLSLLQC